ncbi:probable arabinosyltransferase ARAD1 [Mangifera indica]|uniref:probable arabinosyltransferase ARAD1 n=1 Tax=Mangifera indica TaxID=29780 RepID=UPI001CFC09CC|nr:probable arabinosyltransferase ARAD1 [Mangifera indica]
MPVKHLPLTRSNSRSPIFLFTLALLVLSLLFILFSLSFHSHSRLSDRYPNPTAEPETSFVSSLEHFLTQKSLRFPAVKDDTVTGTVSEDDVRRFDDVAFEKERERVYGDLYYPVNLPIRVYVYEMPRKFTYDLLWLFRNTYKETSNLTSNGSPVHRLIEQHSIDYWLWADLIAPESERLLKNVVRVNRQEEADLFYIPFFTTISFFLMEKQQCKALYREALKWVTDQPAWKRSEGRDHILPVHHPWSVKSVRRYMKNAIWLLPDMDSTGNWYKPGQVSLEKDLILPYVPNVDLCDAKCVSESESKRSTLLFFRGRLKRNAGGKIRAKLVAELTGADGVAIEEGTAGEGGKAAAQNGMRRSIFCLSPAGDTPSSARLFDAIVSGCIPVIVSDELELPFEGILDYRKIALFISSSDALQPGWLLKFLKGVSHAQIRKMQRNLVQYSRHFLYSSPAQPLGPEDLVWRMMAGKLVNIKLHTRRSQRVVKESRSICTCDCRRPNNTHILT